MLSWAAYYMDGTYLHQYNDDGSENKYTDIDRSKLNKFALVDKDICFVYVLNIDIGQKLIYRTRTAMNLMGDKKYRVTIIGWQMQIAGQNIQHVAFVYDNGTIEVTNGFKEGHEWYYPVVFLPEEEL